MLTDWRGVGVGIAASVIGAAWLFLFPSQFVAWMCLTGGCGLLATSLLSRTLKRGASIISGILCSFIIVACWPLYEHYRNSHNLDEKLPGFVASTVLRIDDVTALRRKYVFAFQTPEKSTSTLYLSPNDVFVFSVTDRDGEPHNIEIPLGENGIPYEKFASVIFQEGSGSSYSFMSVTLNGKQIAHRQFPYRIDTGSRNWVMASLNADLDSRNNGAISVAEMGVMDVTLNKNDIDALTKNVRGYYNF